MDHTEALRLQAAEKYVLKELSPALMEEYEVHFFDCAQCAVDIKAATAFAQAARDAFRGDLKLASPSDSEPFFDRLFGWLRPAFTVPLLAGLLLFIGYQNAVTIPTAWRAAEIGATERFRASFLSRGSVPNGGSGDTIQIHEGQPFSLAFDFTPRSDKFRKAGGA